MSLSIEPLALPGVLRLVPRRFTDERVYFVETYQEKRFAAAGVTAVFRQDNQSLSRRRGTVRGLHLQQAPSAQAKLVRVVAGAVYDVAVDLRAESPSYGRWCGSELTAEGGEQLFIPAGFAHGFCTLADNTLVAYKVDGFYDPAAERGIRFDDPDIAVLWPVPRSEVTTSARDAALPRLRDAAPFDFGPNGLEPGA